MEYTFTVSRPKSASINSNQTIRIKTQSREALVIYLSRILQARGMEESLAELTLQLLKDENIEIPDFMNDYSEDSSREKKDEVIQYLPELFYEGFEGKTLKDEILCLCTEKAREWPLCGNDIRLLSLFYTLTCRQDEARKMGNWLTGGEESWTPSHSSRAAVCLDMGVEEVEKALCEEGPLIYLGIIDRDEISPERWGISRKVLSALNSSENSRESELPLHSARKMAASPYTLDNFTIPPHEQAFYRRILNDGGQNILVFHGNTRLFRQEFMEPLGTLAEKQACRYHNAEDPDESFGGTPPLMIKTSLTAAAFGYPLFVENGDDYINSFNSLFFSRLKGTVVFMVSEIEGDSRHNWSDLAFCRDLSALRKQIPEDSRLNLEDLIRESPLAPLITPEAVRKLKDDHRVSGKNLQSAVQAAGDIIEELPGEDAEAVLRFQLAARAHADGRSSRSLGDLKPLSSRYNPGLLNTGQSLNPLENALRKYKSGEVQHPLNVLFWGKPGTGKTEYVKYLASTFNLPLHIYRASDILNKFVGESEERIAGAFRKAGEKPSILFLDEADSFFTSRSGARNSWEVSQTNELLTQMENFRGVLICCTNLLDILDRAVMRRFLWKIEFKAPGDRARLELYRSFFPDAAEELSDEQLRRITAMKQLTPGDLYAAETRLAYADEKLTHEFILTALEQDYAVKEGKKPQPVGFSA